MAANFAIAGLRPVASAMQPPKADIRLCFDAGSRPPCEQLLFQWQGRYGLAVGKIGKDWYLASRLGASFVVSPCGGSIRAFDISRTPNADFMDVLVRRVLPRVALLFGRKVLHAAALAKSQKAVLFLGGSGAGKSTLTAALAQLHGWDLMSDDISVLENCAKPTVSPSAAGVCLWPDSRAALNIPEDSFYAMSAYEDKKWFEPAQNGGAEATPLRALIFLDRLPDISEPMLVPLSQADAIFNLNRQVIHFNPADHSTRKQIGNLNDLSTLVNTVKCYKLSYPGRYESLPDVAHKLEELLQ